MQRHFSLLHLGLQRHFYFCCFVAVLVAPLVSLFGIKKEPFVGSKNGGEVDFLLFT